MRGIELTPDVPVAEVVDHGHLAAEVGFDTVFVSAHYNNRDPFAVLARLAARTETVGLAPGIVNPLETHPVTLAGKVATVAEQSDGRALFGVGPGDPSTLGNLGLATDRGLAPVLETIQMARRLWAGDRVTHDGSFVADDAGLNYPVPGPIPIYVGGEGPDMCRMAGVHADGLLYNGAHPADLAWARDRVTEGLDDRPEPADGPFAPCATTDFDLAAYASVSVAEDRDAALSAARRPVAFIAAGAPEPVLVRHGLDETRAAEIGDAIAAGEFSRADELVTTAMIDAFAVAGGIAEVTERLSALLSVADSLVIGAPLGPDPATAIPLAAEALERARG